jgi:acyl-CoA reductase-like NAD-dependent aldehyde dehydrogenase
MEPAATLESRMSGHIAGRPDGEVIECLDPRSGASTGVVRVTPPDAVGPAVAACRVAAHAWRARPLRDRRDAIAALRATFLAGADEAVALLAAECGRPAAEAWTAEITANDGLFRWWLDHIDDLMAPERLALSPIEYPGKRAVLHLEPVGVIGLILPWNFPLALALRSLVPALLAGNGVVMKPSEHTARLGEWLGARCAEVLPSGLVQVVQGGAAQGQALATSDLDALRFTGSVATGRAVARLAEPRGVRVSLELGGKDAAVVLADADLDRAAAGVVWAAFAFAGQNCAAVERCYVHESVHDAFVERVVARTRALRPLVDVGPLVTPTQLETVTAHLAAAVAGGATVAAGGGEPGPGWFHPPTVLTDVRDDMDLMQHETFGPLLPIARFSDLDRVIDRVNGTPFGLTTSLWTRDIVRGERLARRLSCGVVTLNNHAFTGALPGAAWTGVGDSGGGVTNSRHSLYEMVRPRTVVTDTQSGDRELWWFPYNDALVQAASGLVEFSRPGGRRLQGIRTALSGLLHRWKAPT